MDVKMAQIRQQDRFLKLSLKKNRINDEVTKKTKEDDTRKCNHSTDIMVFDDSFDRLMAQHSKDDTPKPKYSIIVINDSCDDTSENASEKEPSKFGNVSFATNDLKDPTDNLSRPSIDGWSPAQNIICGTPKNNILPTTPKDKMNESLEQCSWKKIQDSHHKLLTDLYGDTWKSIPSLFKTIKQKHKNMDGITKRLQFNDDDEDKENIGIDLKKNKELYLTCSETKISKNNSFEERKSKKKLYTEKIPCTPDLPKQKPKNVKSSTKKGKTITDLVKELSKDVDSLSSKVQNICVTPKNDMKRLGFVASLAENIPSWRCHTEAIQYHDNYNELREKLARRLFEEFNKLVFNGAMEADLPIIWNTKLRSTAGTTTNRLIKTSTGNRIRSSTIKLSTKVLDNVQRLRDTLIHELCHAATWLIDGELRAGHGPLWRKWAKRALRVFPELGEISTCHDMEIHYKYTYKCSTCGYSIKRHSKSLDITKKCCGYCRGTFEVIINKKNKDGVIVSTKAKSGGMNEFALFVKQNYGSLKSGRSHAEVMKLLGEQFSERKTKKSESIDLSSDSF